MVKNSTLPPALTIGHALAQSEPLARLRALLEASNANFATIRSLLPAPLAAHVKPGPVDDEGWTLLADNAAAAAKLRQLLPLMEAALLQRDGKRSAIRLRVQSGSRH
jgi:Dna[CI] antecedent, DciA